MLISTSSWEHSHFAGGQVPQKGADPPEFQGTQRIAGSEHRPRSAVDQAAVAQVPPHGFAADADAVVLEQQHRDGAAGPAAAGEAVVARRPRRDPVEHHRDPEGGQAGAAPAGRVDDGVESAVAVALAPAVDRAAAGEEHGGDGRPGVAVVEQEEDVGPQPLLVGSGGPGEVRQGLAVGAAKGDGASHGLGPEGTVWVAPLLVQAILFRQPSSTVAK